MSEGSQFSFTYKNPYIFDILVIPDSNNPTPNISPTIKDKMNTDIDGVLADEKMRYNV